MMKHLLSVFSCALLFTFLANPNSVASQTKTIIGNKCYLVVGSSGDGTECITTKSGKVCYEVTVKTKQVGFKAKDAYETGSQYRVTLKNGVATRIVFTGRVNKSTRECELE